MSNDKTLWTTCSARNRPLWISGTVKRVLKARARLYQKSKKTNTKEHLIKKLRELNHAFRSETKETTGNMLESLMTTTEDESLKILRNPGPL